MKKRRGFTLVELLATLVVLSIVIGIATVSINRVLNKNKQAAYESKIEIIIRQAKQYAQDNESFLHDSNGRYSSKYVCNVISVQELLDAGYLDAKDNDLVDDKTNDIIDPRNGSSLLTKNILVYIKSSHSSSEADYEKLGMYIGDIKAKTLTNNNDCIINNPADSQSSFSPSSTNETYVYTVPKTGVYRLEVWGAQGGGASVNTGGFGGYSVGEIKLNVNAKLYITVGKRGTKYAGGYNGGGDGYEAAGEWAYGGGGATHIATIDGLLSTLSSNKSKILIVAGGGGGNGGSATAHGGSGGGYTGVAGMYKSIDSSKSVGQGGTQSAAGKTLNDSGTKVDSPNAGFGRGGDHYGTTYGGAGGGGGYWGGAGSMHGYAGGGGGSSYIANANLKNKHMNCYKCTNNNSVGNKTISINSATVEAIADTAKKGDGYAKITYIGDQFTDTGNSNNNSSSGSGGSGSTTECLIGETSVSLDYTGSIQQCRVSKSGWYAIRAWGAQGGGANNDVGGYGAYAYGRFYLNKDEYIYIGVGGQGGKYTGGYNGGGDGGIAGNSWGYGGGGATHVARRNGPARFTSLKNNLSDLIIVAAGGGGNGGSTPTAAGGAGGGIVGNPGIHTVSNSSTQYVGLGGTQTDGGKTITNSTGTTVNSIASNNGFGLGGNFYNGTYGGAGGGGGYYGGGGSSSGNAGAGGGSSYIGNPNLLSGSVYCYNCTESTDAATKTISTTNISETARAGYAKKGNGYVTIVLDTDGTCVIDGTKKTFDFTGSYQTCRIEKSGVYRLDVWGAQGGSRDNNSVNYGGFATGEVTLEKNNDLYVFVGGQGQKFAGGYGGGGNGGFYVGDTTSSQWGYGGGGATYIILNNSNTLDKLGPTNQNILIVAGGGGGSGGNSGNSLQYAAGGAGGGFKGANGINTYSGTDGNPINNNFGTGGTQTAGGVTFDANITTTSGSFGKGGNFGKYSDTIGGAGGGGGFYGGAGSYRGYAGGGGGSGYIGSSKLTGNKYMYCYSGCSTSTQDDIKTYSTPYSSYTAVRNKVKAGDGYAMITPITTYTQTSFDYTGDEQTFTANKDGLYKLEVWGAQGSSLNTASGYGGYSVGVVTLQKNDKLYINVGGTSLDWKTGGYNGGGKGWYSGNDTYPIYRASGGGATHIATRSGLLKDLSSYKSSILIVAGGGGGSASYSGQTFRGGDGGGFTGVGPKYAAFSVNNVYTSNETGGNQTGNSGGGKDSFVELRAQYSFAGCPADQTVNAISSAGSFGQGGDASGGGYYGGSHYTSCNIVYSGSGGSGYIGNTKLSDKHMYCYNCLASSSATTKTTTGTCVDTSPRTDCAKRAGGYAKITYLGAAS